MGWTVIDPKGITGEPEYEGGSFLHNPDMHPQDTAIEATYSTSTGSGCGSGPSLRRS